VIPIQNIYYMLSYAFQVLKEQGYKDVATEKFDNTAELCAAILSKGVAIQIKRGLGRDYIKTTEPISLLRGRIEISESIKTRSIYKRQVVCSYDEFSENSYMNKIIKTTIMLLLRSDISNTFKKELRKVLVFFENVELLDIYSINWNIQYNKNNQTYRMLLSVCYLVIKGLLQTNTDGTTRLMDFLDEQRMSRLYEKFIFEYFRKEYTEISVSASQIPWMVDDDERSLLPTMQSDIMLEYRNNILIIDTKYYSNNMQVYYDVYKLHSSHLYQIFTYVKNKDAELIDTSYKVSGMLLYAGTDREIQPNNTYMMSGNKISVKTLDLNCEFSKIKEQLNTIILENFVK
jgi:5-methylcytosine-specific restriction enzyme subunit McrC